MTRSTTRYTLVALAAIALFAAFASSPASADKRQNTDYDYAMITIDRNLGQETPKGFATKQRRPLACDCTNCSAQHCPQHYPYGWAETLEVDLLGAKYK